MKKINFLVLTGAVLLMAVAFCLPSQTSAAAPASDNLKGVILLQVESNGEAWYIDPVDSLRYYLGRPADAFSIMQGLGLGASHANIEKIPSVFHSNSDPDFGLRFKGRILLDVDRKGEAWYINPANLLGYYLDRPDDAFDIMRQTGLGVTDTTVMNISPNITISGVSYDGTGQVAPDEFVQLVNYGRMEQNLGGWKIEDGDGHRFTFPANYNLAPGGMIRIFTNTGDLSFDSASAIWNNDGDTCFLYGSTGSLVETYSY